MTAAPPVCFLFPGQSSWRSGMLREAAALSPRCRDLIEEASRILGRDLLAIDAAERPACNRDIQVGVLLTSLAHLTALDQAGVAAGASLGLSLGEYAHLVHIGALELEAALRLVDARGVAYDAGPPGTMVAVFPLPAEELARVIAGVEGVEIVNFNTPTQNVIAGPPGAVERALDLLDREHFVQAVEIESRIAMHSSGFAGVADRFLPHLRGAPWRRPRLPYRPNVDAGRLDAPAPATLIERLYRHVFRPVRWRESVERCAAELPGVTFVEVGPGRVLANMLSRRWLPNRVLSTDTARDVRGAIDFIAGELCRE